MTPKTFMPGGQGWNQIQKHSESFQQLLLELKYNVYIDGTFEFTLGSIGA